jgi:hypothetical protein
MEWKLDEVRMPEVDVLEGTLATPAIMFVINAGAAIPTITAFVKSCSRLKWNIQDATENEENRQCDYDMPVRQWLVWLRRKRGT